VAIEGIRNTYNIPAVNKEQETDLQQRKKQKKGPKKERKEEEKNENSTGKIDIRV
jgi:hypothetical protein